MPSAAIFARPSNDGPSVRAAWRSAALRGSSGAAERHTARTEGPSFDGLAKIAALGIKVSRHCTYHGVALNVAMDLRPFAGIDACGYAGLDTVDLSTIGVQAAAGDVAQVLGTKLRAYLSP